MAAEFTLEVFAQQLRILAKYSRQRTDHLGELLDYFRPGKDEILANIERIIAATEQVERENPSEIGPVQHERIAATSGVGLKEVEVFFDGFERLQRRMRELSEMSVPQRLRETFKRTTLADFQLLVLWLVIFLLLGSMYLKQ